MNQENFEQAYVESQAQIALVLAESLGLISEQERTRPSIDDLIRGNDSRRPEKATLVGDYSRGAAEYGVKASKQKKQGLLDRIKKRFRRLGDRGR